MPYIQDEVITGNGSNVDFTLANTFKAGTILITYGGNLFYEYHEVGGSGNEAKLKFDFAPLAADVVRVSYYTITQPNTRNALRYVTPRQVKTLSRVADLIALTDVDIEKIIREVEKYIDTIAGPWTRLYDFRNPQNQSSAIRGQLLTFPRVQDDNADDDVSPTPDFPPIPPQVTQAALFGVENIHLLGAPSSADARMGKIKSEKLGNYSYTTKDAQSSGQIAEQYLGERASSILKGFKKKFGEFRIDEDRMSRPESFLNSRKARLLNRR